jgi:hypothetical protein
VRAGDAGDLHGAAEDLQIEVGALRHLDREVGLDDVVVLLVPILVALVGLDRDRAAIGLDVELDAVEPLATSDRDSPVISTRPEKFLRVSVPPDCIGTVRSTRSVSLVVEPAERAGMPSASRARAAVNGARGMKR